MANTFEVKTMNGFLVTAKMAGMESTANSKSVVSTINNTSASGVKAVRPRSTVKNFCPLNSVVTGRSLRAARMTRFFSGSGGLSPTKIILMPVNSKTAPRM